jgi:hypothetical protein
MTLPVYQHSYVDELLPVNQRNRPHQRIAVLRALEALPLR